MPDEDPVASPKKSPALPGFFVAEMSRLASARAIQSCNCASICSRDAELLLQIAESSVRISTSVFITRL